MADELDIPMEHPLKFPAPPDLLLLGTESELSFVCTVSNEDDMENLSLTHVQNKINWN